MTTITIKCEGFRQAINSESQPGAWDDYAKLYTNRIAGIESIVPAKVAEFAVVFGF